MIYDYYHTAIWTGFVFAWRWQISYHLALTAFTGYQYDNRERI